MAALGEGQTAEGASPGCAVSRGWGVDGAGARAQHQGQESLRDPNLGAAWEVSLPQALRSGDWRLAVRTGGAARGPQGTRGGQPTWLACS